MRTPVVLIPVTTLGRTLCYPPPLTRLRAVRSWHFAMAWVAAMSLQKLAANAATAQISDERYSCEASGVSTVRAGGSISLRPEASMPSRTPPSP